MANPVDEFLLVKKANPFMGAFRGPTAQRFIGAGAAGLAGAGATAAMAGGIAGAQALFNAATKKRDFDNMMAANPHLHPLHAEDPEGFNRMFTSIRAMNPEFTREPMVAGAFMFKAMGGPPEDRGMVAVQARREVKKPEPGPLSRAAYEGFQKGFGDPNKRKPPPGREREESGGEYREMPAQE